MVQKHFLHTVFFVLLVLETGMAQVTFTPAFPNLRFEFPVELQCPDDGSDRFFVVEQSGRVRVFPKVPTVAQNQVETFLDVRNRVAFVPGNDGQEIGLLGLAFHPDFANNGFFYVYYTANLSGTIQMTLARYQVSTTNPNQADPNSERILFQFLKNQSNSNHNGGKIAFGTDGYLYASIGDGGGARDPRKNAQNLDNVFGKILRIDVDLDGNNPVESNPEAPNGRYEIPADNPLVGEEGLDEIYAWGLRNTWKFSFDASTGRLWGADVGQNAFEEINLIQNGENYGWDRFEALRIDDSGTQDTGDMVDPVFFYSQNNGDVSITGGYVYRGSAVTSQNPSISGKYIYGDFVSGRVWALDYNETENTTENILLFRTQGSFIPTFGQDQDGEIYFSNYGLRAEIFRLVDGNTAPSGASVAGVGRWSTLTSGTNGIVNTLAEAPNGDIYVGGVFTEAGGIQSKNLAIWNPDSGWSAFGGSGPNGNVNAVHVATDGAVFIGGAFSEMNGVAANNIVQFKDNQWTALGLGTEGPVSRLIGDDAGNLFVGGAFVRADGDTVNNIARWNEDWFALADASTGAVGTNNEVRALAIDTSSGQVYIGGNFSTAGNQTANRIAVWNGTNWSTLGEGTSGFVQAIAVDTAYIYAGGNFALAGGQTVNRIARWHRRTQEWEALGEGLSNTVNALLLDSSYVYVGGSFITATRSDAQTITVHNLARWSETLDWEALGQNTNVGIDTRANALVLLSDSGYVVVGGNFSRAGAIDASNIAFWQGIQLVNALPEFPTGAITLYPNPGGDRLFIRFAGIHEPLLQVRIFNQLGQTVETLLYDRVGEQGELELTSLQLSSGQYYVVIQSRERRSAFTWIKE